MSGGMRFDFTFRPSSHERDPEAPFRILILGDFAGANRSANALGGRPLAQRKPIRVDVDNLDSVLARHAPQARIPREAGAADVLLEMRTMDDFHPDSLFRQPLFQELARLRKELLDPKTFSQAAARLTKGEAPSPPVGSQSASASTKETGDTLERLLGKRSVTSAQPADQKAGSMLDRLVKDAVGGHAVPNQDPRQDQLVAVVDTLLAEAMRQILHHPAFQALEATWRGVAWLLANVDSEELQIHLLDVAKTELIQDVRGCDADLSKSSVFKAAIAENAAGADAQGWSVLVGLYSFGPDADDVAALSALGALAATAGGVFLAGGDVKLLGGASATQVSDPAAWIPAEAEGLKLWSALRRLPAANRIGLALPRVLLRAPYGKGSDEIDSLPFTEILDPDVEHEGYLWSNPALACTLLLARSFAENGWDMQPGDELQIDDLPAHSYKRDGASVLKPAAEVLLSERTASALLDRGLMPVQSFRDRSSVRVAQLRSIADPPQPLHGPWSG